MHTIKIITKKKTRNQNHGLQEKIVQNPSSRLGQRAGVIITFGIRA
jgi:hypothetical protein